MHPSAKFPGVEIKEIAAEELRKPGAKVMTKSIFDFRGTNKYDLILSRGALILLNPNQNGFYFGHYQMWFLLERDFL